MYNKTNYRNYEMRMERKFIGKVNYSRGVSSQFPGHEGFNSTY